MILFLSIKASWEPYSHLNSSLFSGPNSILPMVLRSTCPSNCTSGMVHDFPVLIISTLFYFSSWQAWNAHFSYFAHLIPPMFQSLKQVSPFSEALSDPSRSHLSPLLNFYLFYSRQLLPTTCCVQCARCQGTATVKPLASRRFQSSNHLTN